VLAISERIQRESTALRSPRPATRIAAVTTPGASDTALRPRFDISPTITSTIVSARFSTSVRRGSGKYSASDPSAWSPRRRRSDRRNRRRCRRATAITCVFLDIGGVLLTDGWDHHARKRAATNFKLELAEMLDRHHLTFDTYEES
jgi:hypothetical protein